MDADKLRAAIDATRLRYGDAISEGGRNCWDNIGIVLQAAEELLEIIGAAQDKPTFDLSKCPNCGGVADQGHDRCEPPNPYYCTKCEALTNREGG